jgi:acetyl esterase/lipase
VNRPALLAIALAVTATAAFPAVADEPVPPEAPVLHGELRRGELVVSRAADVRPTRKTVDGDIGDWTGSASGFGGTVVRSRGELIYTDHLFDAYGADDGGDAERLGTLDPLADAAPETYRLDPVFQQDVAGELGVPTEDAPLPPSLRAEEVYGDLEHVDAADLVEVRLAADRRHLYLLARTTTMQAGAEPALRVVVDGAETVVTPGSPGAAFAPSGWTNAIEMRVPHTGDTATITVVAGTIADDGTFVPANAAFRVDEPVRTWFEKRQALAFQAGDVDAFALDVDVAALRAGATETWHAGPGYHDRIRRSAEDISTEGGQDGVWQHAGVYVPERYDERPATGVPMTVWLHWRGGKAHSAAAVSPRIMRDFGEGRNGIVIAPRGRGTSTWWIGEGLVDVLEAWDDTTTLFDVDPSRVAVSGHSMGGNGSYVLSVLMPDRFAAALPVAGPVTQGAWTGLDFEGCDELRYDEYSPCYVQTNDGDARAQHTRHLLANLRNTPIAIFQGALDELVPVSGVTRQVEELVRLGYAHRYYVFPTYEHYTHPVVDEWLELARYADAHAVPARPRHVTYVRDLEFERRVEQGANTEKPPVRDLTFDSAWWMSGLTPAAPDGVATFDGTSLAVAEAPSAMVPEGGGPSSAGQAGPYAMTGLQRLALGEPAATSNGFTVTVTGAAAVTLDLLAMGIDPARPIVAAVTTDTPLSLHLPALGRTVVLTPGTHEVTL